MGCETANYLYTRCPEVVSTNCITYQGKSIDCLGICKGMTLTKLEDIVVNKICDLATLTNMSVIDFTHKCPWIATAWNNAHPGNHPNVDNTILNILNFILDELCILNTKVDNLPNPLAISFSLDYKCCGGVCDIPTKENIPTHLRKIIDCICLLNTKIESFQTSIGDVNIKAGNAIDIAQDALDTITAQQNAITALSTKINLQKDKINDIINAASTSLATIANLPLIP